MRVVGSPHVLPPWRKKSPRRHGVPSGIYLDGCDHLVIRQIGRRGWMVCELRPGVPAWASVRKVAGYFPDLSGAKVCLKMLVSAG